MIKYNYNGIELVLKKAQYTDGHTCIIITENGKELDRLSTNISKKDCEIGLGKDLRENEILICMTPSMKHPIVRSLALSLEEDGVLMCMYDFIRTCNEYYRYVIPKETMEMLDSNEVIEFVPEEYDDDEEIE